MGPILPKYKGLRLELMLDKLVTCIAVELLLLLISLAFMQKISISTCPASPQPGTLPLPQLGSPAIPCGRLGSSLAALVRLWELARPACMLTALVLMS